MLDKKTDKEIQILKAGGKLLSQILQKVVKKTKIGVSGLELDQLAEDLINQVGGKPSFKNHQGFPHSLCVSINDTVVHGIPTDYKFKEGDVIGLDLGMEYQGLYTDMAVTIGIGQISKEAKKLIQVTKQALEVGIAQVKPGNYISDIGKAIEQFIQPYGYSIVRDLAGHGVGRAVHEDPLVHNFDPGVKTDLMFPGLVIAIEPMIIMGQDYRVKTHNNGWDVSSHDQSLTAHFEHTVAVTKTGNLIITK